MEIELLVAIVLLLGCIRLLYRKNNIIEKQEKEIRIKNKEIADLLKKQETRKKALRFSEGQKVISRSNELDEPYEIGHVVRYEQITQGGQKFPFIEIGDDVKFAFSILIEYSEELEDILKKLSNKEQYLLLSAKHSS